MQRQRLAATAEAKAAGQRQRAQHAPRLTISRAAIVVVAEVDIDRHCCGEDVALAAAAERSQLRALLRRHPAIDECEDETSDGGAQT